MPYGSQGGVGGALTPQQDAALTRVNAVPAGDLLDEAPKDSSPYVRQNGGWVAAGASGGDGYQVFPFNAQLDPAFATRMEGNVATFEAPHAVNRVIERINIPLGGLPTGQSVGYGIELPTVGNEAASGFYRHFVKSAVDDSILFTIDIRMDTGAYSIYHAFAGLLRSGTLPVDRNMIFWVTRTGARYTLNVQRPGAALQQATNSADVTVGDDIYFEEDSANTMNAVGAVKYVMFQKFQSVAVDNVTMIGDYSANMLEPASADDITTPTSLQWKKFSPKDIADIAAGAGGGGGSDIEILRDWTAVTSASNNVHITDGIDFGATDWDNVVVEIRNASYSHGFFNAETFNFEGRVTAAGDVAATTQRSRTIRNASSLSESTTSERYTLFDAPFPMSEGFCRIQLFRNNATGVAGYVSKASYTYADNSATVNNKGVARSYTSASFLGAANNAPSEFRIKTPADRDATFEYRVIRGAAVSGGSGGGGGTGAGTKRKVLTISGATEFPASSGRYEYTLTSQDTADATELVVFFDSLGTGQVGALAFPEETVGSAMEGVDTVHFVNAVEQGSLTFSETTQGTTTTSIVGATTLVGGGTVTARKIMTGVWMVSAEISDSTDLSAYNPQYTSIWSGSGDGVPITEGGDFVIIASWGDGYNISVPKVMQPIGGNIYGGIDHNGNRAECQIIGLNNAILRIKNVQLQKTITQVFARR